MEGNPIWKRARFLMARGGGLHPRPPSLRARGELALFFIFDPFGSVLGRFVSGVRVLVGLCGPFFWCLFAICTGRETSGSLFPAVAPSRAVLSRFWIALTPGPSPRGSGVIIRYSCQCNDLRAFRAEVPAFAGRTVRFTTRSRASFLASGEQRVDPTGAGRSQVR